MAALFLSNQSNQNEDNKSDAIGSHAFDDVPKVQVHEEVYVPLALAKNKLISIYHDFAATTTQQEEIIFEIFKNYKSLENETTKTISDLKQDGKLQRNDAGEIVLAEIPPNADELQDEIDTLKTELNEKQELLTHKDNLIAQLRENSQELDEQKDQNVVVARTPAKLDPIPLTSDFSEGHEESIPAPTTDPTEETDEPDKVSQHLQRISELEEEIKTLKSQPQESGDSVTEPDTENQRLKDQIVELTQRAENAEKKISDTQAHERISELEEEIKTLKSQPQESGDSVTEPDTENQRLKDQIVVLTQRAENAEKKISDTQADERISELEEEIKTLKSQPQESGDSVTEHDTENQRLKDQIVELTQRAENAERKISDTQADERISELEEEIKTLKSQPQESGDSVTEPDTENQRLKDQIIELTQRAENAEKKLQLGLTPQEPDLQPFEDEIKHLTEEKKKYQQTLNDWMSDFKARENRKPTKEEQKEMKPTIKKFNEVNAELKLKQKEIEELREQHQKPQESGDSVTEPDTENQRLKDQIVELTQRAENAEKKISDTQSPVTDTSQALAERDETIETLKQQLADAQPQKGHVDSELNEANETKIEEMKKTLEEKGELLRKALADIEEANIARNSLNDEVEQKNNEIEQKNNKIEQLTRDSTQRHEDMQSENQAELTETKQILDDKQTEIVNLQEVSAQQLKDIETLKQEMGEKADKYESTISDIQTQMNKYRDECAEKEKTLTSMKSEIETLEIAAKENRAQISDLQTEIESGQSQSQSANSALQESQARESKLNDRISSLLDEVSQKKSEITDLTQELENERENSLNASKLHNTKMDEKEQLILNIQKENETEINKLQEEMKNAAHASSTEIEKLKSMASEGVKWEEKYQEAEKENKILQSRGLEVEKKLKEEQIKRKKYYNEMEDMKGKIRVYGRVRPMNNSEREGGHTDACTFPDDYTLVLAPGASHKSQSKEFVYDRVFTGTNTQEEVFADTEGLIQSAFDGYNVCIFAYGQTGSGKTYTIHGEPKNQGICPRAIHTLFRLAEENKSDFDTTVTCYMIELYNDQLMDLLARADAPKAKLKVKRNRKTGIVYVENAVELAANSAQELLDIIDDAISNRHVAETKMNDDSSRSHLIFSALVTTVNRSTQDESHGKLSLIDLAGSERVGKTGAEGAVLKEAQSINKSLSALGNVISALSTEAKHIPYRDSLLTVLLMDSLGGNAKTLMFVNVSPASVHRDETQNSLDYASRAKLITNQAGKNVENKQVRRLHQIVDDLSARVIELGGNASDEDEQKFGDVPGGIPAITVSKPRSSSRNPSRDPSRQRSRSRSRSRQ